MGAVSNPFSAHRVMPGAIPYLFPAGMSAETLTRQFLAGPRLGQIVGPHGSGKTTLLVTLASELRRQGAPVAWLGSLRKSWRLLRPGAVLCADRGERSRRVFVRMLTAACQARGTGLIVTAHTDFGLPALWRTEVRSEAAAQIVSDLSGGTEMSRWSHEEAEELLRRHGGNFREALFELYDRFEAISVSVGNGSSQETKRRPVL